MCTRSRHVIGRPRRCDRNRAAFCAPLTCSMAWPSAEPKPFGPSVPPDWGKLRYVAKKGFDQLTGYGRLNAYRAVKVVEEGRIPPIVDLDGPRWFAIISPRLEPQVHVSGSIRLPRAVRATYRLEYALGVEPAAEDYVTVSSGTIDGDREGPLGLLDFTKLPLPRGPAPRNRDERDRYSVTLRLSATDDRGLRAETRRSFFVYHDPSWKPHFPFDLGSSGEAPPLLVDLDGDGADEIILPTASGEVLFLDWEPTGLRVVRALLDDGPPLLPVGTIDGAAAPREGSVRGARTLAIELVAVRDTGIEWCRYADVGPVSCSLPD